MIRNIVFDMGNVLMRWDPDSFLREFFSDEEDCRAVGARHTTDFSLQSIG